MGYYDEPCKDCGMCPNCHGDTEIATAGRPEGDGLKPCPTCSGVGRLVPGNLYEAGRRGELSLDEHMGLPDRGSAKEREAY